MKTKFYRIISSYFVVGIESRNGIIFSIAPIVKYMKGWTESKVFSYCKTKNWNIEQQTFEEKKG